MLKFIRTVDKSLEDFFILDLKTLGNLIDNVDDHSPDAFRYGKFNRVSCHFAKESAYSLIGRESSCRGKYVVLYGGDCGACNLRVLAIASALLSEEPFLREAQRTCYLHNLVHCTRGIIFFEIFADF